MFVPIIILKGEDKIQKEFDTNETHSKKEKDDNVFESMLVAVYTTIIITKKSEFKYFIFMLITQQKFKLQNVENSIS